MLKHAIILVSALALAACSAQRDMNLSGDEFGSSPVVAGKAKPAKNASVKSDDYITHNVSADVIKLRRDMLATAGDRVRFDYDSAALSSSAQETLRAIARYIKDNDKEIKRVVVEGHADERGTREYNLALGERRAQAAKNFLVGAGVSPKKLSIVSFGKENPEDERSNAEAWAKNRRAVVVLN